MVLTTCTSPKKARQMKETQRKDGQRMHDFGTTDHCRRGQKDRRSTRTPSDVQRQRDESQQTSKSWVGYGASRVVLKADQEVEIADVQRQVVAMRLGETVSGNSSWANRRATAELRTRFREYRA